MRIYQDFREVRSEVRRDLAEMGIGVHTQTYQDKYIGDDPQMATKELQNYMYCVYDTSNPSEMQPTQPWADAEFQERISGKHMNPGEAYRLRKDVWDDFLDDEGKFGYTYPDRISDFNQIDRVVSTLENDMYSRQAYMSVWTPEDITKTGGVSRVPCTLGYQFQIRKGKLNITYLQRSSDFATHFNNDVYLAVLMQHHIAKKLGIRPGVFTHWIGSLHVFIKDIKGVF